MSAPAIDLWERRLERSGLADLDYDDGAGGIKVGNRGSGKVLDEGRAFARTSATAERDQRKAILVNRKFRRGERKVYALYASGLSTRAVARKLGLGRMAVFRLVAAIEEEQAPPETIAELVAACDPPTLVLFFALLERALTKPDDVKALIGQARDVPEIRQLLEPDEVSDG